MADNLGNAAALKIQNFAKSEQQLWYHKNKHAKLNLFSPTSLSLIFVSKCVFLMDVRRKHLVQDFFAQAQT